VTETPVRKLVVLLHADVVGSTALVQKNETLAHERIQGTFRRFSELSLTMAGSRTRLEAMRWLPNSHVLRMLFVQP
jgi:class 3 adenylate cyclase